MGGTKGTICGYWQIFLSDMNGSCHGFNWRLLAASSLIKVKTRNMFEHVPDGVSAIRQHIEHSVRNTLPSTKAYERGNPANLEVRHILVCSKTSTDFFYINNA